MINKKDFLFFGLLFAAIFAFFNGAFKINFFSDDFFFLKISRISSLLEFLNFFNPFKGYFYRPLSTEVFYWLIGAFNSNLLMAHGIVLLTYFIGIYYLYRSLIAVTRNKVLSQCAVVLFALNFTHVFQLYWLATFQEVLLFATLCASFYLFVKQRFALSSLFFICALLSKETALMFPFFLALFLGTKKEYRTRKHLLYVGLTGILFVLFLLIYKYNIAQVAQIQTYAITLTPRLMINNLLWYFLWGIGLPNFMYLYVTSIFRPPLPEFWNLFRISEFKIYFPLVAAYLACCAAVSLYVFVKEKKKLLYWSAFSMTSFFIFLIPFLPILHKWMVRLAVPLIFLSLFQGYILSRLFKGKFFARSFFYCIFALYLVWNFYAVRLHESSSLYQLEARFVNNADKYFAKNKNTILKHNVIYIRDDPKGTAWGGSKKLKVTFHDQDFLDYYFPGAPLTAVYDFEATLIPKGSYIVPSSDLLK